MDELAPGRRRLEPLLHPPFRDVHRNRRLELAVGQLGQIFAAARDADIFLDIAVPGRDILVADRPVDPDILALVRLEILRAPAERPTSPDQRLAANRAGADPVEFLALVEGVGVQPVVVVELLVAGRDIAVLGDEIVALDQPRRHPVARRNLERRLAVIGIVLAMLDHHAAVEHQHAQPLLGQLLGRPAAADA